MKNDYARQSPSPSELPGGPQDAARETKNTATKVMESAEETANKAVDATADKVQNTADTLRDKVEGDGGIREKAGTTVADTMEDTAGYLREHDSRDIMSDIRTYVKEHPVQTMVTAVAFAFLAGRVFQARRGHK
jgi:ElaB/YqjD/DUF883 family membrane-anchored ribosome-binding protein